MKPEHRTALVTGSTRGIGLGVAKALARAGFDIALHGAQPSAAAEGAQREVGEAGRPGQGVLFFPCDLEQQDRVGELVDKVERELGPIDVLVNNAGIQHVSPVDQFSDDRWDAVMAVNLSAAFRLIRAALPGMKMRRHGRIVNIASVHGLVASANKAAYVASKHGLIGLTRAVALEVANAGVTCNAICPGWVLTDLVRAQAEAEAVSRGVDFQHACDGLLAAKQPMKAFSSVDAIGELTAFLCSDAAATMTGAAVAMDGGWTAV